LKQRRARLPRHPDEPWQAVLTALQNHTAEALSQVVASPLGLWLLCAVHIDGRRDPQPLIDLGRYPDAAAIRHHLLEELIPATIRARPPRFNDRDPLRSRHRYDPEQARRWLTTMAIELRNANTRDWRWWRLARHTLTIRQIRLVYGLMLGLVGLVNVLGGVLAAAPENRLGLKLLALVLGLVLELALGLVFGLVFGLLFWLAGWSTFRDCEVPAHAIFRLSARAPALGVRLGASARDAPRYTDFELRSRGITLGANQVRGLVGVVLTGVLVLELVGEGDVLWGMLGVLMFFGLMLGLPSWLVGRLVGRLVSFVASPSIAQRASSPIESQAGDRQLTFIVTSVLGLVLGVIG
jgi:hypothetical protein